MYLRPVERSLFNLRVHLWNFHAKYILNGWNDSIIQPARDAVLDYCKVGILNIS